MMKSLELALTYVESSAVSVTLLRKLVESALLSLLLLAEVLGHVR